MNKQPTLLSILLLIDPDICLQMCGLNGFNRSIGLVLKVGGCGTNWTRHEVTMIQSEFDNGD